MRIYLGLKHGSNTPTTFDLNAKYFFAEPVIYLAVKYA